VDYVVFFGEPLDIAKIILGAQQSLQNESETSLLGIVIAEAIKPSASDSAQLTDTDYSPNFMPLGHEILRSRLSFREQNRKLRRNGPLYTRVKASFPVDFS
jgi:hypothetical protein